MSNFGERLKILRKEHGLQQTDVSEIVGIKSRQAVSHWETGRYQPDYSTITKLANYFDVDIDYLLGKTPYRRELEELQAKFGLTIGQMKESLDLDSDSPFIITVNKILSNLVQEIKSEYDKTLNPYLFCSVLINTMDIMKKLNQYLRELNNANTDTTNFLAFSLRGSEEIYSQGKSTIIEWTLLPHETKESLQKEMFFPEQS